MLRQGDVVGQAQALERTRDSRERVEGPFARPALDAVDAIEFRDEAIVPFPVLIAQIPPVNYCVIVPLHQSTIEPNLPIAAGRRPTTNNRQG